MTQKYTIIEKGAVGTVIYNNDETIVHKLYSSEKAYEYELDGYQRARKIIENELANYKDYFVSYLGEKDVNYTGYYNKSLVFTRYDGSLAHYFKNNKWLSGFQIRNIMEELLKIFTLLERMWEYRISHNDIKDLNILYKQNEDFTINLVLCDYAGMNYMDCFPVEEYQPVSYYFAFTPMISYLYPLTVRSFQTFKTNNYDMTPYSAIFFREMLYKNNEYKSNEKNFNRLVKSFPYCSKLKKQKYNHGRFKVSKFHKSNRKRNQMIETHFRNNTFTRETMIQEIVQFNDLYGFAIVLITFCSLFDDDDYKSITELKELIFQMIDTRDYFHKSIHKMSEEFHRIYRKLVSELYKNSDKN